MKPRIAFFFFLWIWGGSVFANEPPLPFTIVVPPLEFQDGGTDIFSSLPPNTRLFVNQKLNLELLGPGTNLIFVTDETGDNWGFAISNGRFDWEASWGTLGTYPDELPHANVAGKYPWPKDAKGRYLPGNRLVTSNGPHTDLKNQIASNPHTLFFGGHVGIDRNGKPYIGYVAGLNSAVQPPGMVGDARVLPVSRRKVLHYAMSKAFSGRNIETVLQKAPVSRLDVEQSGSSQHFPPGGNQVPRSELVDSPYELRRLCLEADPTKFLAHPPELRIRLLHAARSGSEKRELERAKEQLRAEAAEIKSRFGIKIPIYRLPGDKTALEYAVENRHKEVAAFLLQRGADPLFPSNTGSITPLLAASKNLEMLELLVSHGVDLTGTEGTLLLSEVIARGEPEALTLLLSKGLNPEALGSGHGSRLSNALKVAEHRQTGAEKEYLIATRRTSTLNRRLPALHFAAKHGFTHAIRRLLAEGADPNEKDHHGRTALHWSARGGHVQGMELLLLSGAKITEDASGLKPGNPSGAPTIYDIFESPNSVGADGITSLHRAASYELNEMMKHLASQGADLNARDSYGRTPLNHAYAKRLQETRTLLELGADPNLVSLHTLVYFPPEDFTERLQLLSSHGANMEVKDSHDQTPLAVAIRRILYPPFEYKSHYVVEALLESGADPNATLDGQSLLHHAALKSDVRLVDLLLSHRADPNRVDVSLLPIRTRAAILKKRFLNRAATCLQTLKRLVPHLKESP